MPGELWERKGLIKMTKVAIIIIADTVSFEDMTRLTIALEAAKEFNGPDEEVKIIFDGAATAWLPKMSNQNDKLHILFNQIKNRILGACLFCAKSLNISKEIEASGIPLLGEYEEHPSIKRLIAEGYNIITF